MKETGYAASIDFRLDPALQEQCYAIRLTGQHVTVAGGDPVGLMYGGLELGEMIRLQKVQPSEGQPFIQRRGLKMNIPLDIRTPSYQDAGDAAQANIAEMWNWDFWREFLDTMARYRYNTLTLWNPHPFPSMVQLRRIPRDCPG
jgi:hypothetical protein